MRKRLVPLAVLGLIATQVASAHVEPAPERVKAGSVAKVTFEVEAEEQVPAIQFAVQLPASLQDVMLSRTKGWKQRLSGRVATWSGGRIQPEQTGHFALTARWPESPGATLVFPSVVTYQGGKAVHWIGPESAEFPAARVRLIGSSKPHVTTIPTVSNDDDSGDSSNAWIWIVVAVGAVGLLALAAVLLRRRRA